MTLRTTRERVLQTCLFEVGGIALVTPLYAWIYGASSHEGLMLLIAISIAVLIWAPVFGTVFDMLERHWTGRVASDRPHHIRVLHAVLYEATAVSVTLPLAMSIGGLNVREAAALNVQLTLFYIAYAYVFHLMYDTVRPVPGGLPDANAA